MLTINHMTYQLIDVNEVIPQVLQRENQVKERRKNGQSCYDWPILGKENCSAIWVVVTGGIVPELRREVELF